MTQEEFDWKLKQHILAASYRENHNWSKELHAIKSPKAPKQWTESRKILNELLTHQKTPYVSKNV